MQNGQFGSKIKNAKKVRKTIVTTTLEVVVWKNRSKKHLIFEKWEHFENGQNWPRCMGYSPCKMVSLGQKLKMPKRCEKQFYDHIKVVVNAKNRSSLGRKTPNIRKMTAFWKWPNWPRCMGYSPCKMVSLGQKLKMPKRCEKRLYRPH